MFEDLNSGERGPGGSSVCQEHDAKATRSSGVGGCASVWGFDWRCGFTGRRCLPGAASGVGGLVSARDGEGVVGLGGGGTPSYTMISA